MSPTAPDPKVLGAAILSVAKAVGIDPASLSEQEIDFCVRKAFEMRTELWINKEHAEGINAQFDEIKDSLNITSTLEEVRRMYPRRKLPRRKYNSLRDLVDAQVELAEAKILHSLSETDYASLIYAKALELYYSRLGVQSDALGRISLSYAGQEYVKKVVSEAYRVQTTNSLEAKLSEETKKKLEHIFNNRAEEIRAIFDKVASSELERSLEKYVTQATRSVIDGVLDLNLQNNKIFTHHIGNVMAAAMSGISAPASSRVQNRVQNILNDIDKAHKEQQ